MAAARATLVGVVAYVAVSRFAGSAAAATISDLWQRYLGDLPVGPVVSYGAERAGLFIPILVLAAPVASALFGRGSRSIVWLVIATYAVLAPVLLSSSWIDWFRFLGDEASRRIATPEASATSALAAALVTAVAHFLLWQTDRLQGDVGRLRRLGVASADILRYAGGYAAVTAAVTAGALFLAGVAYGIARGVMAAAGQLDPRSWVSFGAMAAGLIIVAGTAAFVATARDRQVS
jgi:hypothetical protein